MPPKTERTDPDMERWTQTPLKQYGKDVRSQRSTPIRLRPTDDNLLKAVRRWIRRRLVRDNDTSLVDSVSRQEREDGFNQIDS